MLSTESGEFMNNDCSYGHSNIRSFDACDEDKFVGLNEHASPIGATGGRQPLSAKHCVK
jgi:hypothetical protein